MKRLITICITILLIPLTVMAHPGSLDSNGGHHDRKTGEYHYHSGIHKYGTSLSSTTQTYYPYTPEPTADVTPEPTIDVTPEPTLKSVAVVASTPEPETESSLGYKISFYVCMLLFFGIPAIILLIAIGGWIVDGVKFVVNRIKSKKAVKSIPELFAVFYLVFMLYKICIYSHSKAILPTITFHLMRVIFVRILIFRVKIVYRTSLDIS